MPYFGEVLKLYMDGAKLTQASVAKLLGTSQGYVSQVVRGERPVPEDWIPTLLKALNLSRPARERFLYLAAVTHIPESLQPEFISVYERVTRST